MIKCGFGQKSQETFVLCFILHCTRFLLDKELKIWLLFRDNHCFWRFQ